MVTDTRLKITAVSSASARRERDHESAHLAAASGIWGSSYKVRRASGEDKRLWCSCGTSMRSATRHRHGQGHFPVGPDAKGTIRLGPAPNGALLLGGSLNPVRLVGMDLGQAIARILEVRAHG